MNQRIQAVAKAALPNTVIREFPQINWNDVFKHFVQTSQCDTPIRDFFHGFLEECRLKGLSNSTLTGHTYRLNAFVNPIIGNLGLRDLNYSHVYKIAEITAHRGTTVTRATIVTIRRLLAYVTRLGYVLNFEWREIEIPNYRPKNPYTYLTREELDTIRESLNLEKHDELRARMVIELIVHTGLRISEVLSINREDIDFDREELTVRNVKTKSVQTVFTAGATKWIQRYLESRNDNHPALVLSCGDFGKGIVEKRWPRMSAKNYQRYLRKKANLRKHITWTLFRKTYCTLLLQNGVDIKTVQRLMRHQSERTTLRHYAAVDFRRCKNLHSEVMKKI